MAGQWEELQKEEADFRIRISKVEAQISEAEIHAELGKKLLNQLQGIGKQIVQEIPSLHQCPLCGTKNIGAKTILTVLFTGGDKRRNRMSCTGFAKYEEKRTKYVFVVAGRNDFCII